MPPAPERIPATDAVAMIEPPFPFVLIAAAAYLIARKTLRVLIFNVRMKDSELTSSIRKPPIIPAFAKKMSSLPYLETVSLQN